jgi:hypothetical protein
MAFTILALSGCSRRVGTEEWVAPMPAGDRMAILDERARQWEGYQAVVHFSAESTRGTLRRVRSVVLAAPPDMLRIEALSPFGQAVGLLLFDRQQATLWIPSEKAVYTAGRAETLIQRFLGLPIPVETFIYSLVGVVPRKYLRDLRSETMGSVWRAQAQDPSEPWMTTWEFGSRPFVLKEVRVAGDSRDITVRYDPPVDLTARNVPERLVFSAENWRLEVKIDQIQSVREFQGGAFQSVYPSGLRRIDLDHSEWKGTGL